MRRACVLRQLGRCARPTPLQRWECNTPGFVGLLRRKLPVLADGTGYPQFRRLSSSAAAAASWRVAAPSPPSAHPSVEAKSDHDSSVVTSLPEQLRTVMRLVPHPVVVCTSIFSPPASDAATTTTTSSPQQGPDPRGMTMSSFTSLTLHPTPIVTFNVATPSRTLDAVSSSRVFNVHVLSGDAEGARVADWFRRGNAAGLGVFDPARMREGCGCEVVAGETQQDLSEKQREAPLLRGKGVLYVLRCRLLDDEPARGLLQVRDHVLVLAEVVRIIAGTAGGAAAAGEQDERFGLVYADRRYRQLGGTMVDEEA